MYLSLTISVLQISNQMTTAGSTISNEAENFIVFILISIKNKQRKKFYTFLIVHNCTKYNYFFKKNKIELIYLVVN